MTDEYSRPGQAYPCWLALLPPTRSRSASSPRDGLEVAETYQTERVEEILELFDWTGLPVRCQPISLDRLKGLLLEALNATQEG